VPAGAHRESGERDRGDGRSEHARGLCETSERIRPGEVRHEDGGDGDAGCDPDAGEQLVDDEHRE
jgi:hypothetical protein